MDEKLKEKTAKLSDFLKAEGIRLDPVAQLIPRDDGTFSIVAKLQLTPIPGEQS